MKFLKAKYLLTYVGYQVLDTIHSQFLSGVERQTYEESGFPINSIIQHQHLVSEIALCEGNFYFPLPKKLIHPMKGLINIQNEEDEWFRMFLLSQILKSFKQKACKNQKG